jgi:hypothetical protein
MKDRPAPLKKALLSALLYSAEAAAKLSEAVQRLRQARAQRRAEDRLRRNLASVWDALD